MGVALLAWGALVLLRPDSLAAHAGEVPAEALPTDQVIAAALVSVAVGAIIYWRRHQGAT